MKNDIEKIADDVKVSKDFSDLKNALLKLVLFVEKTNEDSEYNLEGIDADIYRIENKIKEIEDKK